MPQNVCDSRNLKRQLRLLSVKGKVPLQHPIKINDNLISEVSNFNLLEVTLNNNLNYHKHITSIIDRRRTKHYAATIIKAVHSQPHKIIDKLLMSCIVPIADSN